MATNESGRPGPGLLELFLFLLVGVVVVGALTTTDKKGEQLALPLGDPESGDARLGASA